jgi:HEAT repeat protein
MQKQNWSQLIEDLRSPNVDLAVRACEQIAEVANESNIAELYSLMNDEDFFVREAAALPLARLEGIRALPDLFEAHKRGSNDGHDNDGLTATIVELLEANQEEVTPLLLNMVRSVNNDTRRMAAWALGFVASQISPVMLFELVDHDQDFAVRAAATGALGSFKGYPEVFDKLLALLQDTNLHVKVAAIAGLGYFGNKQAISHLQNCLKDANDTIRFSVQFAIERLTQENREAG